LITTVTSVVPIWLPEFVATAAVQPAAVFDVTSKSAR
jgi:hypothetical protein